MSGRGKRELCKICKKSSVLSYNKICRDCDTTEAGNNILGYLSELGYIISDDIFEGHAYGVSNNNFLDLNVPLHKGNKFFRDRSDQLPQSFPLFRSASLLA